MNNRVAKQIGLQIQSLLTPIIINLAFNNGAPAPIVLKHFVCTSIADTSSRHAFDSVLLKLGPNTGRYDTILGTPFLTQFRLSAPITTRSLVREISGQRTLDYRLLPNGPSNTTAMAIVTPTLTPALTAEQAMLDESKDLFPIDIPALSDEAKEAGLF
ncbi:hypothetical protein Pst134EA_026635 [Puccinia striiformis f. sp. tritici]|uniref:hypothetical protein n=1 Tax=Puccinia striiformis f. sp. tritici TaxID=168172 RepID=UPI002007DDF1|nr:hypothetical protein Pst134EA_026635 [Puccinia striiformis f. sp. tritici]KAH9449924.1 hypothetical protein Pst134EA_026635 [Puccinia striiformis f. sp. tritici]